MDNFIIKMLSNVETGDEKLYLILAVIAFVVVVILLFVYLASCIVIVKQGTRKIVERFGSYNRTLKEGLHIIFRPFDTIAPVPWNVLSISERDEFEKARRLGNPRFFNDKKHGRGAQLSDEAKIDEQNIRLTNYIAKRMEKDIRLLTREDFIDRSENVSAAFSDNLDYNAISVSRTGKTLNNLIDEVVTAKSSLDSLVDVYHELGFDPYKADPQLVKAVRDRDALAASVRYYPRHQDPHSHHASYFAKAENHILDYVDLREKHIDTSKRVVRELVLIPNNVNVVYSGSKRDLHNFDSINLITKDNASIGANIVIFFSITDPFLYYYGVEQPEESLVLLAITTLRNIVSSMTLEEALNARCDINKRIREELDIASNNWGIKANRVEIKDFQLAQEMQEAMDNVLIAEREKRANLLRAEAYKKMKEEGVMAEHIKLRGYEALEEVSRGKANKVFIPSDLSEFITGAHVVADAFAEAKKGDDVVTVEDVKTVKSRVKK